MRPQVTKPYHLPELSLTLAATTGEKSFSQCLGRGTFAPALIRELAASDNPFASAIVWASGVWISR